MCDYPCVSATEEFGCLVTWVICLHMIGYMAIDPLYNSCRFDKKTRVSSVPSPIKEVITRGDFIKHSA